MSAPQERTDGLSVEQITMLLTPFAGEQQARLRAEWMIQDMNAIGYDVRLSGETPGGFWEHVMPQPEYVLPPNQFDVNGDNGDNQLGGSFVTAGNLPRLAQSVEIARTLIPHLWPHEFTTRLLGAEHLNALNEIWWLKFWRAVKSVSRGPKASKDAPDFEWQIQCHDGLAPCTINLEVKRRIGTINQFFKRRIRKLSLDKIAKKFGPVPDGTCNIVALTVYLPISERAWRYALSWLERQDHVHGIIIWMEASGRSEPMRKCIKSSHRWVEFLLLGPQEEDHLVTGVPFGTSGDGANPVEEAERMLNPSGIIVDF